MACLTPQWGSASQDPRHRAGQGNTLKQSRALVLLALLTFSMQACTVRQTIDSLNVPMTAMTEAGFVDPQLELIKHLTPDGYIIEYRSGPTGDATADAQQAARIVWTTTPYRVNRIDVPGRSYLRPELESAFGPRNPAFDERRAQVELRNTALWMTIAAFAVLGLIVVAVVGSLIRSRGHHPEPDPA